MKMFKRSKIETIDNSYIPIMGRKVNPTILHKPNRPIGKLSSRNIDYSAPLEFPNLTRDSLRIGYWSTWQVKCGIAVYTEHLYNALKYNNITVFGYSNKLTAVELLQRIDIDRIHILNIQYEPAIVLRTPELIAFIHELHRRRVKVILTFHSESKSTEQIVSVIDQCIFHKNPSHNIPKDKLNIIPMGVPVFNPSTDRDSLKIKYGFKDTDIIMSTTGFMFTWKQHANILNLLAPTIRSNPNYKVQLLTAFNDVNPEECIREKENIRNVINLNNIQEQVIHIDNFLSQQELSERLYLSDLGYLYGELTTTSSSAAGKEFITSRLPLVVTQSNHYHDLNHGVIKTIIDRNEFVNSIFIAINNRRLLEQKRLELESLYNQINNNEIINKHIEVFLK